MQAATRALQLMMQEWWKGASLSHYSVRICHLLVRGEKDTGIKGEGRKEWMKLCEQM